MLKARLPNLQTKLKCEEEVTGKLKRGEKQPGGKKIETNRTFSQNNYLYKNDYIKIFVFDGAEEKGR